MRKERGEKLTLWVTWRGDNIYLSFLPYAYINFERIQETVDGAGVGGRLSLHTFYVFLSYVSIFFEKLK